MSRVRASYRFARVPEWILWHPDLDPVDVRVYATLDRFDGDRCIPALATISERVGKSPDTIRRSIAALAEVGALEVRRRADDAGRQTSNEYLLAGDSPLSDAAWVQGRPGMDARDGGGMDAREEGGMGATRSRARKIQSKKINNSEPSALPRSVRIVVSDAEWSAWWSAYPRKDAKARARERYTQARKAGVPAESLLGALQAQAKAWRSEAKETRFMPHAATWLHQRRFEDELGEDPKSAPKAKGRADGMEPCPIGCGELFLSVQEATDHAVQCWEARQ